MKHTVRILMPCYNTAEFVGEAFASVVRQKPYCDLFLVCVDDGSDPDQYERIRKAFLSAGFEKGHAVLKRLEKNTRLTGAWRECTKYFKECEYTTWLDSDDYYCRDDVFSDVARLADESSPDCIAFRTTDEEPVVDSPMKLARRYTLWMCCKCVKTEFTPSFSGDSCTMNDVVPHMEICDKVDTVAYVGRKHFFYRNSPLSISKGRRFGSIGSAAYMLETMAAALKKEYSRGFVRSANASYIHNLLKTEHDRIGRISTGCEKGEKFVTVAVPYPSTECMPASSVVDALNELHSKCVFCKGKVEGFLVPCGSKRALDAFESELSGRDMQFRVDRFVSGKPAMNGTSAMFSMMLNTVRLKNTQVLAFIPPWWRPVRDIDLSRMSWFIDDSVFSVELAGWPWSECKGYMNYFPRREIMPGYVAVKSVHMRDRYVFNPSVPQLVNTSKLLFMCRPWNDDEQAFLDDLNSKTYYGQYDNDLVLVPAGTDPYFKDILGTDPAYRPVPEEKSK